MFSVVLMPDSLGGGVEGMSCSGNTWLFIKAVLFFLTQPGVEQAGAGCLFTAVLNGFVYRGVK